MALINRTSKACFFASLLILEACSHADTAVGGHDLDESSGNSDDESESEDTDTGLPSDTSGNSNTGDGGIKESINETHAASDTSSEEDDGTTGGEATDLGDTDSGSSSDTSNSDGSSDTGESTTTAGETGTTDSTTETSGDSDGGTDSDTQSDDACRDRCGTPNCGTCPPDRSIEINGFSIDATELKYRDYQFFVDANVDPLHQPAECKWNDSMIPAAAWPPDSSRLDFAIVYVNWCQARAYCEWAGKRLCGDIDGGGNAYISYNNHNKSQWYHACSDGGNQSYPYGDEYDPVACNGEDFGITRALPVPTMDTCEGPFGGLFDMNGNVYEWTDECEWNSSSLDRCRRRGGSFYSEMELMRCRNGSSRPRDHVDDYTGFRCCSI